MYDFRLKNEYCKKLSTTKQKEFDIKYNAIYSNSLETLSKFCTMSYNELIYIFLFGQLCKLLTNYYQIIVVTAAIRLSRNMQVA